MKGEKDWQFSQVFADATPAEQAILLELTDILYRVQYAAMGKKPNARRVAAIKILKKFKKLAKEGQL